MLLDRYDIGVAVQTEQGLVVPVVHGSDRPRSKRSTPRCAAWPRAAQAGTLKPEELRGGTFTVTSAGKAAGLFVTPLDQPPGGGHPRHPPDRRASGRPRRRGRRPQDGNVSVTFDHRVIDGKRAADFGARGDRAAREALALGLGDESARLSRCGSSIDSIRGAVARPSIREDDPFPDDERERRNLADPEPLRDLRPVVHVDLADAKRGSAPCARCARAGSPSAGRARNGGRVKNRSNGRVRLGSRSAGQRPNAGPAVTALHSADGCVVLDRRLRRPGAAVGVPLPAWPAPSASALIVAILVAGAIGAAIGFGIEAGSRAAGETSRRDRRGARRRARRGAGRRGALRRGGTRGGTACSCGRGARARRVRVDPGRRLSRGARAARSSRFGSVGAQPERYAGLRTLAQGLTAEEARPDRRGRDDAGGVRARRRERPRACARVPRRARRVPPRDLRLPVAHAGLPQSIATGAGPDVHHIPSLSWWNREEKRIVEYGSSFGALRKAGFSQGSSTRS